MAVKTNSNQLKCLLFLAFVLFDNSLSDSLNDIKCDESLEHCYEWVNAMTCALMNGKFYSEPNCVCCQRCLIERDLLESCYQSIPGFKVQCREGLFCSRKHGLICIDMRLKLLEESHTLAIDRPRNPIEDKIILLVPEHKRPLKRIPRKNKGSESKPVKFGEKMVKATHEQ